MKTSAVAAAPWAVVQRTYRFGPVIASVLVAAKTFTFAAVLLAVKAAADLTAVPPAEGGGISAGINIPLDSDLMELCKKRAATEISRQQSEVEKSRLDFELVRGKLCLEMIKNGGFFHPESPYGKVCADIVGPSPNGYLMTGNGQVVSKITK